VGVSVIELKELDLDTFMRAVNKVDNLTIFWKIVDGE